MKTFLKHLAVKKVAGWGVETTPRPEREGEAAKIYKFS